MTCSNTQSSGTRPCQRGRSVCSWMACMAAHPNSQCAIGRPLPSWNAWRRLPPGRMSCRFDSCPPPCHRSHTPPNPKGTRAWRHRPWLCRGERITPALLGSALAALQLSLATLVALDTLCCGAPAQQRSPAIGTPGQSTAHFFGANTCRPSCLRWIPHRPPSPVLPPRPCVVLGRAFVAACHQLP